MAQAYLNLILHLIIAGVCAITYWRAAQMEQGQASPFLWSSLSISVFIITWLIVGWGWAGIIIAQVSIALLIAIIRTIIFLRSTRP